MIKYIKYKLRSTQMENLTKIDYKSNLSLELFHLHSRSFVENQTLYNLHEKL